MRLFPCPCPCLPTLSVLPSSVVTRPFLTSCWHSRRLPYPRLASSRSTRSGRPGTGVGQERRSRWRGAKGVGNAACVQYDTAGGARAMGPGRGPEEEGEGRWERNVRILQAHSSGCQETGAGDRRVVRVLAPWHVLLSWQVEGADSAAGWRSKYTSGSAVDLGGLSGPPKAPRISIATGPDQYYVQDACYHACIVLREPCTALTRRLVIVVSVLGGGLAGAHCVRQSSMWTRGYVMFTVTVSTS